MRTTTITHHIKVCSWFRCHGFAASLFLGNWEGPVKVGGWRVGQLPAGFAELALCHWNPSASSQGERSGEGEGLNEVPSPDSKEFHI
jgi:hypothetical protein